MGNINQKTVSNMKNKKTIAWFITMMVTLVPSTTFAVSCTNYKVENDGMSIEDQNDYMRLV